MKTRIAQRMRARRQRLGYQRALATADPSMRQELIALATRQNTIS
jgi:hypothetical protein